jgi:hypothetical protein
MGEQAGDTGLMPPFLAMWGANLVLGAAAIALLALNHREAAFDPLDPRHYLGLLPRPRGSRVAAPATGARPATVARKQAPVVLVRIPRFGLRFPTLLDRYIARSFAGHVALVLAGARWCSTSTPSTASPSSTSWPRSRCWWACS